MKLFKLFLIILLSSSNLLALLEPESEPTNDSCPGQNILNTGVDTNVTVSSAILDKDNPETDLVDYYSLSFSNDGVLDFTVDTNNKNLYVIADTTCGGSSLYNGTIKSKKHTQSINITSGSTIYIKVYLDGNLGSATRVYDLIASFTTSSNASYTCPTAEILTGIDGTVTDSNATFSESSTGTDKARYFKFTPATGGEMTVSYGDTDEKQVLDIGTSCEDNSIHDGGSGGTTSDSHSFYVLAGTTYYVKILEKNNNDALKFTADFQFKEIEISFDKELYSISEDINLADNALQELELTIVLSHPASFDIDVTYSTLESTPQSAIIGTDFTDISSTVTFSAGETEKKVYIDIIHDTAIELEENFIVELSNIVVDAQYSGVVNFGVHNPIDIIILEQDESPICYEEDFSGSLDADWRLLYSDGGYTPEVVSGRLRMTTATGNLATAMTKDYEFIAAENLISIEFDHYAYSGSGADGFAIVLYDSSVGASPGVGAFGGSLGYAQKDADLSDATVDTPGFEGGWLGLGLDEYGNYSNPTEGRDGGLGFISNAVAIRGQGSGQTGYTYLAGTNSLSPVLWSTTTNYSGGRFRLTIDSRDTDHLYLTLERDEDLDGTYEPAIIDKIDAIGTQGTPPDYIRLAVTASTGGSNAVHELDELLVKGVCREYNQDLPDYAVGFVDAVDSSYSDATYTDANGPDITTKISGKGSYNFDAVYLGEDNSGVETYNPTGTFSSLPMTIEVTVADQSCENGKVLMADDGSPFGWIEIPVGSDSGTTISPVTMPANAMSTARLKLQALDWNSLFNSLNVSNSCKNSSTHGSLCGVPSCLGSAQQANEAFPPDGNATNQLILTECYGLASDGSGSIDSTSPCNSSNFNGNCGGVKVSGTIIPSKYDNKVGCLSCILNKLAESTCSEDLFSIRPEKFTITSSENSYPDLLRAAEDYNVTITATDYLNSTATQDYNQTSSYISTSGVTKWTKTGTIDNTLNGVASLTDFNITNGVADSNATFTYSDVGEITLEIQDINWSSVDSEDTIGDCSETGRYICGDMNTTFIPHHFSFVNPSITNNNGNPGTFTYLANLVDGNTSTYNMAARVNTLVEARNKLDAVTQNFKNGSNFYENNVSLSITVVDNVHGDANVTSINNSLLGFGVDNGDSNGTRTLTWDESNTSKVLRFNFPRAIDIALNPFDVNGSDLNISINSLYTGTAPEGSATIIDDNSGKETAIHSVTMLYGRTHAGRQRYEGASGNVNIYFEAYCFDAAHNTVACEKNRLPNGTTSKNSSDIRWFINYNHNTTSDGLTGTAVEHNSIGKVSETAQTTTNSPNAKVQKTLTYWYNGANTNDNQYPYKTTMENNASSWLIYNNYDSSVSTNEFPVEFEKASTGWSGEQDTTTTTIDTGVTKTNRRSMW